MNTEGTQAPQQWHAGWECKPDRPVYWLMFAIGLFSLGLLLGAGLMLYAWQNRPDFTGERFDLPLPVAIQFFALVLLFLVRAVLLVKTRFWLCLDNERIVLAYRCGHWRETVWAIRVCDIQEIAFKGGSFVSGRVSARIRGKVFLRNRRRRRVRESIRDKVKFTEEALLRHPRLLDRLIELAEPKCQSPEQRLALDRAKRFAQKISRETPPEISSLALSTVSEVTTPAPEDKAHGH